MADGGGDDTLLVKIAVMGVVMSMVCTAMIAVLFTDGSNGDYSLNEINDYRDELSSFTGESMVNYTPWVLEKVYTPWVTTDGVDGHVDADGWLFGRDASSDSSVSPYLKKAAYIKLDPNQKSTKTITIGEDTYQYQSGIKVKDWAHGDWVKTIAGALGIKWYDKEYSTATNWDYTGYRYVFDPTLPFKYSVDDQGNVSDSAVSSKDGKLSLVWYSYGGQEGLSGGLQVYGGQVLLASYSASDIIADYNSTSGYATTYDFDFQGAQLDLRILFDADAIEQGTTLQEAWTRGLWSMAITSVSAGNFFDISNSSSFSTTAGSMIKTFSNIFTFNMGDQFDNPWAQWILWCLVGLPMILAMLLVTLRLVNSFRVIR